RNQHDAGMPQSRDEKDKQSGWPGRRTMGDGDHLQEGGGRVLRVALRLGHGGAGAVVEVALSGFHEAGEPAAARLMAHEHGSEGAGYRMVGWMATGRRCHRITPELQPSSA